MLTPRNKVETVGLSKIFIGFVPRVNTFTLYYRIDFCHLSIVNRLYSFLLPALRLVILIRRILINKMHSSLRLKLINQMRLIKIKLFITVLKCLFSRFLSRIYFTELITSEVRVF